MNEKAFTDVYSKLKETPWFCVYVADIVGKWRGRSWFDLQMCIVKKVQDWRVSRCFNFNEYKYDCLFKAQ